MFEKFIKVSVNEFGTNPPHCDSLPGYTWQCGLKYTRTNLQSLQDKDLVLALENNIRGGFSSVMGHRYVKSDENKKIIYMGLLIYLDILWFNLYFMLKLRCGMVILILI